MNKNQITKTKVYKMYEPKFLQHAFFWQQLVTLRFEFFAKQRPPTIANSKHLHEVYRSLDLKSQAYFTNCYTLRVKDLITAGGTLSIRCKCSNFY